MITTINNAIAKRRDEDEEKGFTLIELLVVILIIGILAAIAIPVFLGQQNQAKDTAAKSDLSHAKTAMISYATNDPDGNYLGVSTAAATETALGDHGYVATDGLNFGVAVVTSDGAGAFCLEAESGSGTTFSLQETGAAVDTGCVVAP